MAILEGLLRAQLSVELDYRMTDNKKAFTQIWSVGRVMCSVEELIMKL